jgi:hypothetical protein
MSLAREYPAVTEATGRHPAGRLTAAAGLGWLVVGVVVGVTRSIVAWRLRHPVGSDCQ